MASVVIDSANAATHGSVKLIQDDMFEIQLIKFLTARQIIKAHQLSSAKTATITFSLPIFCEVLGITSSRVCANMESDS
jgi:hypothetical protein